MSDKRGRARRMRTNRSTSSSIMGWWSPVFGMSLLLIGLVVSLPSLVTHPQQHVGCIAFTSAALPQRAPHNHHHQHYPAVPSASSSSSGQQQHYQMMSSLSSSSAPASISSVGTTSTTSNSMPTTTLSWRGGSSSSSMHVQQSDNNTPSFDSHHDSMAHHSNEHLDHHDHHSAATPFSNATMYKMGDEIVVSDPSMNRGPLKVLFLSADTGGGHRASAESLGKQFQINFPGSTYDLLDVWTLDGILPYKTLVQSYKHLSAHPRQWRFLYHLSNSRPWELAMDFHSTITCEHKIRKRIASYDADVIISVHPTMNNAPRIAVSKISSSLQKHIPFYTVVTDLGSGHCTWFQKDVDKLYVASERLYKLAKRRGRTPDNKLVKAGLPIRHDFNIQATAMNNNRTIESSVIYRQNMKQELGIDPTKPMILLMGGGEGVGSLSKITDSVYKSFIENNINATICVICGRNEKLKNSLEQRDWNEVLLGKNSGSSASSSGSNGTGNNRRKLRKRIRSMFLSRRSRRKNSFSGADQPTSTSTGSGNVKVVGLGFITNMAEYMVASDILITKAGPGTIAEAASVGLPVMLTSFLPGQEAGNVAFVLEKGFGDYQRKPKRIASTVTTWLQNPNVMSNMSNSAHKAGYPNAAADIVLDIGSMTHTWMATTNTAKTTQTDTAAV